MHKSATKCNETVGKWCKNKHGASKIIDTLETYQLPLPLIIFHITCISLSLHRTSAPIHLISVLGVLGTQETSCILIAGLLERDIFDLFLPEFDKP
jgi:hypothetical protein